VGVRVPFGRKEVTGFVVGFPKDSPIKDLKEIQSILGDVPFFNEELLALFLWVSSYYCAPLGQVLKTALPSLAQAGTVQDRWFELILNHENQINSLFPPRKKTDRQTELLHFLLELQNPFSVDDMLSSGFSRSTLNALVRKGLVKPVKPTGSLFPAKTVSPLLTQKKSASLNPDLGENPSPTKPVQDIPVPSQEQQKAIDEIKKAILKGGFNPFLLEGITGSGKTEVYIHAIQATLQQGKKALFLVPEIALTTQLIERLRSRLGEPVAIFHSGLSPRERRHAWSGIQTGEFRVALGVRSAVFAPFSPLGLIVIDEEQDASYKQGEGLRYHARDVALMRAKKTGSVVILGSATPSLETYQNSQLGKYGHLYLTHRVDHRPLPKFQIIDLRDHSQDDALLSPPLLKAINDRLEAGEQILLFLNRRGFRPGLLCRDCGHTLRCPNCSVGLTLYKKGTVLCHYCDFETQPPEGCPECHGIRWGGVRGGTEKLEEEVRLNFPKPKPGRMDRDTTRRKNAHGDILKQMADRRCDILIGTQMIAKGHDLPGITLVGIVLADVGLTLPDFRASERLFQVVTQVAGRCGRGSQPGEVIIQTFNPKETTLLFAANHQIEPFYQQELGNRKVALFPPYCRLALLVFQGNREEGAYNGSVTVKQIAINIQNAYPVLPKHGIEILGPVPAPIGKIRGKYRFQLLIKAKRAGDLQQFLKKILNEAQLKPPAQGVEFFVDVDPPSFL
jgi:primosomal protein N' (replication factor Y)